MREHTRGVLRRSKWVQLITHLMKAILGIICIVAGLALFFAGLNRKDSLAGHADRVGTSIANSFDGGVRTPRREASRVQATRRAAASAISN